MHMRVTPRRNRDGWYRGMNMGLDLAPLTTETSMSPETHVPEQSRPHKPGGEKPLRGKNPRMRGNVKELEQFLVEDQRHKSAKRTKGHVPEQRGGSKENRDQAEGRRRPHLGDLEIDRYDSWRAEKQLKL